MNIVQVKIPCTDLRVSAAWYSALLELDYHREFVEQGEVAGVVLAHSEGWVLGLRLRTRVPGQPSFQGFDLRFLAPGARRVTTFVGVEQQQGGPPTFYDQRRL